MIKKYVLIVDDDAELRSGLGEVLKRSGYELVEVADGIEGLAKAETLRPDVILLDIRMPGLDGYTVCRRLKLGPQTRQIPVILLTGVEDLAADRLADLAGAVVCLAKPFPQEVLLATIQETLATATRQAAWRAHTASQD